MGDNYCGEALLHEFLMFLRVLWAKALMPFFLNYFSKVICIENSFGG